MSAHAWTRATASLALRVGVSVALLVAVFFAVQTVRTTADEAPAALVPAVHASAPSLLDDGAQLYLTYCMSCHMMGGEGVPGTFPPLAGSEWVTGDKGRLIRIVLGGLSGEIEVDGEVYNGAMPPWGFLNDEQAAALLTHIRASWGNEAEAVTPDEVAAVRAATKDRKGQWHAEELLQPENSGIPGQSASGSE